MGECNATLTTATVERGFKHNDPPRLHTIMCDNPHDPDPGVEERHWHKPKKGWDGSEDFFAEWTDDTPGATPHKPPLVSDAEFNAAMERWGGDFPMVAGEMIFAMLEAAAKVRMEDE